MRNSAVTPECTNPFHQQGVFVPDFQLVAEEDLLNRWAAGFLYVLRLYEGADHRNFQGTNQISHKDKAVFQDTEKVNRVAAIIVRDLAANFLHSFLNLFGGDNLPSLLWQASVGHRRSCSFEPRRGTERIFTALLSKLPLALVPQTKKRVMGERVMNAYEAKPGSGFGSIAEISIRCGTFEVEFA